jgi:ferrous iron transport protein A
MHANSRSTGDRLMARLDQLQPGQLATIVEVAADPTLVQRLAEMGLLEGEVVEFLGTAPLGDPMEIRVGNTRLSLRIADAAKVIINPQ